MELIFVLVGLLVLIIPVAVVYLLVSHGRLKAKVAQLEVSLAHLRESPAAPGTAAEPVPATETKPLPQPQTAREAQTVDSPWKVSRPAAGDERAPAPPPPAPRPRPVAEALARFGPWLRDNWFYAVSALSLALAGIFLVQYGVEAGLLPPRARVVAALLFGATLIGVGEVIRRRFGDDVQSSTAYLPSVFSGAGVVTIFGGILSARLMYGLVGPEVALVGMVFVAVGALVLGLFHGPLLAAVGVVGAFAGPFVVGGSSDDPTWLYGYFALIALLGLGVDTVRRWAWVSALTLVLAFAAGWLLLAGASDMEGAFALYLVVLVMASVVVPARSFLPDQDGAMMTELARARTARVWPGFPTTMAFGAMLAGVVSLSLIWMAGPAEFWLVVACLAGLTLIMIVWSVGAPALQDLAALPALGLGWVVFVQGMERFEVFRAFTRTYAETAEADFPLQVSGLVALGLGLSLAAAWRSLRPTGHPAVWGGAAAVLGPALAVLIEVAWTPTAVIGAYPWALHALGLAAVMVVLAERFARLDGENRLRTALFTLSALSCAAFACVIVLSSAALTVALAVTVLAAAALDARFDLRPMGLFIAAGVATLGYRLVVDPGLGWGRSAPLAEVLLAYGGTLAALAGSLRVLRARARPVAATILDSAAWSTGGLFSSLLIWRWIETVSPAAGIETHWGMGLLAAIWLGMALAQLQRSATGQLVILRLSLAVLFGAIGGVALARGITVYNPLLEDMFVAPVLGPWGINTLAVAYLLPALVLGLGAWRVRTMPRRVWQAVVALALALGAVWLTLTIRHFWNGAAGMALARGVSQPELYSYTMALLLVGAGLFYQSLARRSGGLRRAGLVVIGLAVAKVFLIDISGLAGLTRVFSLLVLGLSLAGLAWLNRWAQGRMRDKDGATDS